MQSRRRLSSFALLAPLFAGALTACSLTALDAPPESTGVATGRAVGKACAFDTQCASQRCSADVASGSCGICLDVQKLGAACDGPQQGCSASAVCTNGICTSTKKVEGEACEVGPKGEDIGECDDSLFCQVGKGGGKCRLRFPVGASCGSGAYLLCVKGAVCDTGGHCSIPPAGSCRFHACAEGMFCDENATCKPATLLEGETCGIVNGSFVNNDCGSGTVCEAPKLPTGGDDPEAAEFCVPLPGAGEICDLQRCAPGLFCSEQTTDSSGVVPMRCDPLRQEGESCNTDYVFHKDCAAGLECRDEVCAPACK